MGQGSEKRIRVTAAACIAGAVMFLSIPLRWLIAWLLAAAFHEGFHCLALWICGRRVESIFVDWNGAKIYTEDLATWETVLCALAGPAGSLMLLLPGRIFPEFALCILLQSTFNLLPISSLDGGRALLGALECFLPQEHAEMIFRLAETILCMLLALAGVWMAFRWKVGVFLLLVVAAVTGKRKKRKIPCKWRILKVQ